MAQRREDQFGGDDDGSEFDGPGTGETVEIPGPDEVPRRVLELGITVELCHDVVRQGQGLADFCTVSHPRWYPPLVASAETTAALRDATAALGWSFADEERIATTTSPDGAVTITVNSGDEWTGLRGRRHAQTRSPRGAASVRLVRQKTQYEFDVLLPISERQQSELDTGEPSEMWYLLFRREGDTVRSELSRAKGITDSGALIEWSERLLLPEIDMLDGPPPVSRRTPEPTPDVDVPVVRRSS